jgi:hypothetical protein
MRGVCRSGTSSLSRGTARCGFPILRSRGLEKTYYWEHLGRLDLTDYAEEWKQKRACYERWFPGQVVTMEEGPKLSSAAAELIAEITQ